MNIKDLSTRQILKIVSIRKKIEKLHAAAEKRVGKLQARIDSIAGNGVMPRRLVKRKKRRMSRAGRARIAAAARARWAKAKAAGKTRL